MAAPVNGTMNSSKELQQIREQAAEWIVLLDAADNDADYRQLEAQCAQWQQGDPRRGQVLGQMQQIHTALDRSGSPSIYGGLLSLLLIGVLVLFQLPWGIWSADYRSGLAEVRQISLPDGSTLVLNADSAVNLVFDSSQRVVHLLRGELLVTVSRDVAGRPFSVRTSAGSATALGTVYQVRLDNEHMMVRVQESSVRVSPLHADGREIILQAGQQVQLSTTRLGKVESVSTQIPDWVEQRLVFHDMPLALVVHRLRQYRPGLIAMPGQLSRSGLHFTGVLPVDDNDAALDVLAKSLDLHVLQVTPYFVWLSPGDEKK